MFRARRQVARDYGYAGCYEHVPVQRNVSSSDFLQLSDRAHDDTRAGREPLAYVQAVPKYSLFMVHSHSSDLGAVRSASSSIPVVLDEQMKLQSILPQPRTRHA
jgi:hypothetical protein